MKEKKELEQCPFHPKITTPKERPEQKLEITLENLYKDAQVRKDNRNKDIDDKTKKDDVKLKNAYNYTPFINKPINHGLFTNNNLMKDDHHVLNEKKRFEKARKDKKILELQQKKGIISIKDMKNAEELLQEDNLHQFDCTLEKKTFKDGFHNLNTPSKNVGITYNNTQNSNTKKGKIMIFKKINYCCLFIYIVLFV